MNFRRSEMDSGVFWYAFPAWQCTHTNYIQTAICTRRTVDRLSGKLRQKGRRGPNPPCASTRGHFLIIIFIRPAKTGEATASSASTYMELSDLVRSSALRRRPSAFLTILLHCKCVGRLEKSMAQLLPHNGMIEFSPPPPFYTKRATFSFARVKGKPASSHTKGKEEDTM